MTNEQIAALYTEINNDRYSIESLTIENAALKAVVERLREALGAIEQRANERHSGEMQERETVYAIFKIAQAALKGEAT